MSRTLHLFGTDWCAMMVPIQVIRWYRMQCYDGTDSCAIVVPIRRYCHIALIAILANIDHTPKNEQVSATRENIQKDADSIRIDSIRKADRIDKVKHSIKIIKAYLSAPNSAGGVDAHLVWKNVSKKTIKYLTWSGYPINAVGDPVSCEIRRISESGGKVTGPIKPGATDGYDGCWECLWYNYSAKKLILTGIDIEYMDGSTMRINQNELKYIR